MKNVAMAIGGFDTGGGAGVESDIKTMEALGVHGVAVVSALTAQNTQGIREVLPVSADFFRREIEAILEDFQVKCIKTGMIYTPEQMKIIHQVLPGNIPVVVDPVIYAKDGTKLIADVESFKQYVIPKAFVITPNAIEAEILSGIKISGLKDQILASRKIHEMFSVPYVIVKGGHVVAEESVDVLYDGKDNVIFKSRRIEAKHTHGTGSVFASAICSMLAQGHSVENSTRVAKDLLDESIGFGLGIGKGVGPVDPIASLHRKIDKLKVLEDMVKFADFAENERKFHMLIPEVQSNLAHSIDPRYVRSLEDVATYRGRIIREWGGRVRVGMPAMFGFPTHTARLLLSVISKGSRANTLMNIRYDPNIVNSFKKLGYEVFEVDRTKEPEGPEGRTMNWLAEYVYSTLGKIPNVIFDRGKVGKEAMIRFWTSSIDEMVESLKSVLRDL
ncbi:bifunctional hydroxymethylpyrimidine kinase/phosphomethylpyrimidine kinase [Metallosphaera tengchongensis]|uniref:Bifunctional hydroxymethylpyrimidine kinase/phosphomethylpyrimidine kinase n=1 Tax=Metallosphaera tengchongensis TaxID=1532350 RepID=A0A6N0NWD1_9CREN|nr:bifunctional hydroxymethylpyrimidine kinase/phosphomethylpyrimidine kinase [Metallosphaera tengchongensis]QKR00517.1 bifunctional hydroxymethylpyrimidine kinase/phosphomethylpyrimidine kinase [Metallosphaera tengchongensis]